MLEDISIQFSRGQFYLVTTYRLFLQCEVEHIDFAVRQFPPLADLVRHPKSIDHTPAFQLSASTYCFC